jgi:DHA1 family bicyclomycin/chloramphenicol resistance-like MFS transporter
MIRDLFPPEETARVLSMVILTMGVAPILAPLLGQMVSDLTGWRG